MKTASKLLILLLIFTGLFTSCDDDIIPDKVVTDTFKNMFPKAKYVEWEMEYGYYVAEFRHDGYEKEAWFDTSGDWKLTNTDYERNVPDVVKTALDKTEYVAWRIDDVHFIEWKDKDSFYVVEVEKGEMEKELYFSKEGELLEEKPGSGPYRPMP